MWLGLEWSASVAPGAWLPYEWDEVSSATPARHGRQRGYPVTTLFHHVQQYQPLPSIGSVTTIRRPFLFSPCFCSARLDLASSEGMGFIVRKPNRAKHH